LELFGEVRTIQLSGSAVSNPRAHSSWTSASSISGSAFRSNLTSKLSFGLSSLWMVDMRHSAAGLADHGANEMDVVDLAGCGVSQRIVQ
jgi:hypothetical protein